MDLIAALPADPRFYLVGIVAVGTISLAKGAFGGGLAIVGIPIMALALPPLDAAIMLAPLFVVMDVFTLNSFGPRTWSRPDLKFLLPALIGGIALGALFFVSIDPRKVALTIGVLTLAFCAHFFLRGRGLAATSATPRPALAALAGIASGFTTFVAHSGGPPLAMYLLRRGLDKTVYAGTTAAVFMLGNLVKAVPYGALGLARPELLVYALVLTPVVPLGVAIGRRLHDRLSQKTLYLWCYVLLTAAAAKMTWDAVWALVQ